MRRNKYTVLGILAILLVTASALWGQFVDYSGRNNTSVFKSIILSGTTRGEISGPEITRVSATVVGVPGLQSTTPLTYDHNTTITAFATGGQASATALTGEFNNVTTVATAGDSVKLMAAAAGAVQIVKNSGAAALAVFPATGDAINALAVNLSVEIPVGGEVTFRAIDSTTWETNEAFVSNAPTTQKGTLVIRAADSAGNTATTITNASQAAARTYTIPDAGASASFVMTEGAATINGVKTFDNTGIKIEDSNASHGVTISPGDESADRVLSIPVLGGADTIETLGTAQTVSGVKTYSADPRTSVGVGAVAGAGVTVVENGNGAVHRTVFTLSSASITVTDSGGAGGGSGGLKIYDFPEGVIVRGGCVANATTLAGAGGIADGAAVVLSLGSVTAAADATLTSTEADFIASFAGTLAAGAGAFTKYGEPSVTSLDGHTTAVDLFLNMAVPDADISASDTLAVSGTITCTWWNNGDWT